MSLEFGKLNFSTSFKPTSAFPLDANGYFESYSAAVEAAATAEEAGSSNTVYYYGQNITVVEDNVATLYIIQPNKTLKEVGSIPVGDNKTVTVVDGKIQLLATDTTVDGTINTGAQLTLQSDGTLKWVKPDTSTTEGQAAAIADLQGRATALETTVGNESSGLVKGLADEITRATTAEQALDTRVSTLETTIGDSNSGLIKSVADNTDAIATLNGADTVNGSVAKSVKDAINDFATKVTEDGTINTFKELIEYAATHSSEYSELAGEVTNNTTAIGVLNGDVNTAGSVAKSIADAIASENLSQYAKATDVSALSSKVTALENVGAEKNIINSVDEAQFTIDENRKLTLDAIAMSKVTGLDTALAGKVDAVEGSRLITAEESTKLDALVVGKDNKVTISADNIEGLDTKLDGKVDKVAGKSLVSDILISKLEGIETGAQANVIEAVKLGGTALTAINKAVDIPIATSEAIGVVKGSTAENQIAVTTDGTMEVNSVNVNKLTQTDGDVLVLNGGTSAN